MSVGELHVTIAELGERITQELAITDWRAVVMVVVAAPGLEHQVEAACEEASASRGLAPEQVLHVVLRRDDTGREQLRAFNRARDSLLKEKRLVLLRANSAADVRFLREVAPDLIAAIDVYLEVQAVAEGPSDWSNCEEQLRSLMASRHGTLDFTGLLPASVEQRVLPLDELYQSLVELRHTPSLLEFESEGGHGWFVIGHPGTGKTTFVRHLAWTYALRRGDPLEIGAKVPLLVSLSDYGDERETDRVRSLVGFLPGWLVQQGIRDGAALTSHLPEVLLLLDGLDELRSVDARRAVLAEISQLTRAGRVGGVVVTGRSFLVDELKQQDHALRLITTVEPRPAQTRAFVETFVRLRHGAGSHAKDLISKIEEDPDLSALARTPLMLAFMVILDELEGRLPDRRIEIYYRLGEMLVDRWTRARSIGANASRRERPTRADALRVLGPLAWWTVERGSGAVSEQALFQEIERIEARRETREEAKKRAGALLELLRSDTALLVPVPGRRWRFVHASIGEYFAGVEVERDPQRWAQLLESPFRAEWREIALFCAGQLGVIEGRMDSLDRLVKAILEKSKRGGRYDAKYPSLLVGLLMESPGLSGQQIDRLVERLLKFLFVTAYSDAALFQMQDEIVSLLRNARGAVDVSLGAGLREWFSKRSGEICWERVMGLPAYVDKRWLLANSPMKSVRRGMRVVTGGFVTSLVEPWVTIHHIDLEPTLKRWAKKTEWPFRLATWWVRSNPEDRDRPFAEIAAQIPD